MTDWVGLFQENYSNFHPGHETKGNFGAGLFFRSRNFQTNLCRFPSNVSNPKSCCFSSFKLALFRSREITIAYRIYYVTNVMMRTLNSGDGSTGGVHTGCKKTCYNNNETKIKAKKKTRKSLLSLFVCNSMSCKFDFKKFNSLEILLIILQQKKKS